MMVHRRAVLGGLAASPAVFAVPGLAEEVSPDAILDAVFAENPPPALGGALVSRDGLDWVGVRGLRRANGEDPATIGDRWHIGSNTKAMTAAVFARLVEAGGARWDMTLDEAFPDIPLDAVWRGVPLTRLMSHRSGLIDADVLGQAWFMSARSDPRSLVEQRAAIASRAFSQPPSGTPGAFAYSNAGYIIVGAAIEALTGRPWETVIGDELFQPLGLASARFGAPPDPAPWGHREIAGRMIPIDPADPGSDNPAALGPAGTVHMSLADQARWLGAMMGGGPEGWLGPDSRTRLTTTADTAPAYAFGWIVQQGPLGPLIAHEGSNTLWHAIVAAAPGRGLGFVAVANAESRGAAATQALVRRLMVRAATA